MSSNNTPYLAVDHLKSKSIDAAEPIFERRLDEICKGLQPHVKRHLLEKISQENTSTIIEYVLALKT